MRNGGLRRERVDRKDGIGVGVADNRDVGGVNERLDASAEERKAAGLLDLVGHAKGRLAQTSVDGQGLHGEQAVGGHGYLRLGELVCELDLGEIDRGDDVLVNLGGYIDGSLVVCRGRRVEGAGATKASTRSFRSLRVSMETRFYVMTAGAMQPELRMLNRLTS